MAWSYMIVFLNISDARLHCCLNVIGNCLVIENGFQVSHKCDGLLVLTLAILRGKFKIFLASINRLIISGSTLLQHITKRVPPFNLYSSICFYVRF